MKNDEPRPRVPARVTVWLTCGCVLRMKDRPISYQARYPCPSNLGHGYRLRWTEWRDGNLDGHNPRVQD